MRRIKKLKKLTGFVLALILVFSLIHTSMALAEGDEFAGGDGSPEDPYQIASADQLNNIRNHLSASYILMNDIDLSAYGVDYDEGKGWQPIGNEGTRFQGSFDGKGYTISNLYINRSEIYVGLFGNVDSADIQNVKLVDINVEGYSVTGGLAGGCRSDTFIADVSVTGRVKGNNHVGGLVGYLQSSSSTITGSDTAVDVTGYSMLGGLVGDGQFSSIENCYTTGPVTGDENGSGVGGLMGSSMNGGSITNCYATGVVTGGSTTGGLMGSNKSHVTNCYATGVVTGGSLTGGLVGHNSGSIINCYATGMVTGDNFVAGLIGVNIAPIDNCYATGRVTGSDYVGGLIGANQYANIVNCYAMGVVTGNNEIGGLVGTNEDASVANSYYSETTEQNDIGKGELKTTIEMKQQDTFSDWDFTAGTGTWRNIQDYTFPVLQWQSLTAEEANIYISMDKDPLVIAFAEGDSAEGVIGNLTLPTTGVHGTTISWGSSQPSLVAGDGTVTRPTGLNTTVTLTATVSLAGGADQTKDFTLQLIATAGIISTLPTTLCEAPANDGNLSTDTLEIVIGSGTLAPDITKTDVSTSHLPEGLDYTITRTDDTNLTITISGKATRHANAYDVDNLTFTIAQAKVSGAVSDLTTGNIRIDFFNPPSSSGGATTILPASWQITPEQISQLLSSHQSLELQYHGLQISIGEEALSSLAVSGVSEDSGSRENIQLQTSVLTNPASLNTFFIAYPGQKGIMKGYSITFSRDNNGQTENIIQLDGDISLTFELSPEELEGIDPSTLIIYKQGEDGSITELSGEFDWDTNSFSVSTSHLCEFYIMGQEGIPTQRLAGENRYETAVAISQAGWQTSDDVILVSGENFPDALAGTVLAGILKAPVLLTTAQSLSNEALAEIKRLKAKNIYILGGTGVISETIGNVLSKDYTVKRISGLSRYETAQSIGQLIYDLWNSGDLRDSGDFSEATRALDTIILATGENYPDALSIAPFAGRYGFPILFTKRANLDPLSIQSLNNWGIKNVIIVGGLGAVSVEVEDYLRYELQLNVTRLSGEDRYLTSLEIAKYFENYPEGVSGTEKITGNHTWEHTGMYTGEYKMVALATGENFPDALAGAGHAVRLNLPIILTEKDRINPEIEDYLHLLNLKKSYLYGGKGAIAEKVKEGIRSGKK